MGADDDPLAVPAAQLRVRTVAERAADLIREDAAAVR
jgi:hypothetical protein